jgi:hypothetical protein
VHAESNCEAVAAGLPGRDGNGDSALGVGEREKGERVRAAVMRWLGLHSCSREHGCSVGA